MSHIKVEFTKLQGIGTACSQASKKILQARNEFHLSMSRLDWEVKSKSNISSRAQKLVGKLDSCELALYKYSSYITTAHSKYAVLENYRNGIEKVGNVETFSNDKMIIEVVTPDATPWKETENELDAIKKLISLLEKFGLSIGKGIPASMLGLIVTASKALREGVHSAEELLSSLSKVWSSGFSVLDKVLNENGIECFGKMSAVLSMFGGLVDFQNKNSWGEAFQGAGGLLVGTGKLAQLFLKDAVVNQIVSEGFTKEFAKQSAKGIVKTTTQNIIEPLVAFGSTCSRYVGDVIEFSKDGTYTMQEFSRTLLDSGLAGASSWIKSLTCGVVDINVDKTGDYIMDACNSGHDYMEKNDWPTWAKIAGSIVGAPITLGIGIGNMIQGKALPA